MIPRITGRQLVVAATVTAAGAGAIVSSHSASSRPSAADSSRNAALAAGISLAAGLGATLGARMLHGLPQTLLTGAGVGLLAGGAIGASTSLLRLSNRIDQFQRVKPDGTNAQVLHTETDGAFQALPGDLLPDITPVAAADVQITGSKGQRQLRFSTSYANIGRGPLEMVLSDSGAGATQQAIYNSDGTRRKVDVNGSYIFDTRPGMQHLHFDDFGRFELFKADGNGVATEKVSDNFKVSFLITNTDHFMPQLDPDGLHQRTGYKAGSAVQGMSVGWGDTYASGLSGQFVDFTNQSDGQYILRMTFDPNHHFAEVSRDNNSFDTLVTVKDGDVSKVKAIGSPRAVPGSNTTKP